MSDIAWWQLLGGVMVLTLLVSGGLVLAYARRTRTACLPAGRIVSADVKGLRVPERLLFSARCQLAGKPDYLLTTRDGLIPVEVKSSRTPPQPYLSHILQLTAYCFLVEEAEGQPPPYGFIKYPEQTFQIEYSDKLRDMLLSTLEAMRADLVSQIEVHRDHNETRRCLVCGYRTVCDEALA